VVSNDSAGSRTAQGRVVPAHAFHGLAFSVFAFALAMGALVHEFQSMYLPAEINIPVVVAALAVLLRPASPVRLVLLLGLLVVECVLRLPNPVNHQMLLAILGVTLGSWWLWLLVREPRVARDPAALYAAVAPFLRVAFILTWAFAALSKLNSGFTNPIATCAVWILESIPAVQVPQALAPAAIAGTIALELAVPTLLLFHRSRPWAIVLGFGFHAVSAVAGHAWFSGFGWAFYALFLPPVVLARGVVVTRRALPARVRALVATASARGPLTLLVLSVAFVTTRYGLLPLLPDSNVVARYWGAQGTLLCLGWMGFTGWILYRLRAHWLLAPGPRARLRVRSPILWVGIAALVLNAATPYLGIKTRAAFTMFSNLRTEPGHWNHLVIPESVRVFHWLDGGDVRFLEVSDPGLVELLADWRAEHVPLLGARRLVADFPDATVRYTLDGVERVAAPVRADPVLGRPLSPVQYWYAAIRPYAEGGTCQH
jgi:hypothetical protein